MFFISNQCSLVTPTLKIQDQPWAISFLDSEPWFLWVQTHGASALIPGKVADASWLDSVQVQLVLENLCGCLQLPQIYLVKASVKDDRDWRVGSRRQNSPWHFNSAGDRLIVSPWCFLLLVVQVGLKVDVTICVLAEPCLLHCSSWIKLSRMIWLIN